VAGISTSADGTSQEMASPEMARKQRVKVFDPPLSEPAPHGRLGLSARVPGNEPARQPGTERDGAYRSRHCSIRPIIAAETPTSLCAPIYVARAQRRGCSGCELAFRNGALRNYGKNVALFCIVVTDGLPGWRNVTVNSSGPDWRLPRATGINISIAPNQRTRWEMLCGFSTRRPSRKSFLFPSRGY